MTNRISRFTLLIYAAFLTAWLVYQPLPPLQDYMDWIFQGWVGAQLLAGSHAVAEHFVFVRYPVPNVASQCLLILLTAALGPFLSAKIFIFCLLAAMTSACSLVSRKLSTTEKGPLALLLFLSLAANSCFWNGYINYQLSILLFLCFLVWREQMSAPVMALVGIAIFSCHASTFLAFGWLCSSKNSFSENTFQDW